MAAIGRNAPCPCGSGLKYKRCCALKSEKTPLTLRIVVALVAISLLGGLVIILTTMDDIDPNATGGRVWSEAHGHWH